MAINPTIIRTKPKLSDYLFDQDKTKFKLNKKSSRPWIINNEKDKSKMKNVLDDNLVTDFENIVSIHRGADPNMFLDKEGGKEKGSGLENYLSTPQANVNKRVTSCENKFLSRNKHFDKTKAKSSQYVRKHDQIDSINTQFHSKNVGHSPNSQRKYQNSLKTRHVTQVYDQEEDTEEDRLKQQLLERDIELEYQQQVKCSTTNRLPTFLIISTRQVKIKHSFRIRTILHIPLFTFKDLMASIMSLFLHQIDTLQNIQEVLETCLIMKVLMIVKVLVIGLILT